MYNYIMKQIIAAIIVLGIMVGGFYFFFQKPSSPSTPQQATNYEECTKIKGSIIMESYPQRCKTPDGKTFTAPVENPDSLKPPLPVE